jgi:thioesterase domain-containing protein
MVQSCAVGSGRTHRVAAQALRAHPLVASGRRYVLGGWSVGGSIAHAMEAHLDAAGLAPSALLMLDAQGPFPNLPPTFVRFRARAPCAVRF